MTPEERSTLIQRYAEGPRLLRAAYESAPEGMRIWKPERDEWSVHEIVCHCADSETGAAQRLRMLVAEENPYIIGYDQDAWAHVFDYHNRSIDLAFQTVDAVRAWTAPLLPMITEDQWAHAGTHSESGPYSTTDWLATYGNHLHVHVDQIQANIAAWRQRT